MNQVEAKLRYRVNVATTSKGLYSFDCTVESDVLSMEDVLAESDKLVEALKLRYGPVPEP